jgi:hypothetical protein
MTNHLLIQVDNSSNNSHVHFYLRIKHFIHNLQFMFREESEDWVLEPDIFLRICTHTQTITISNDLCPPVPTMLFKLRPCIQK